MWTDDLKHFVRYEKNGERSYVISLSSRINPISDVHIIRHYWQWMRSPEATEDNAMNRMIAWHDVICDTIEDTLQRDVDYVIIRNESATQQTQQSDTRRIWGDTLLFLKDHGVSLPSSEELHNISRGLYNRDFHLICDYDRAYLLIRCAAKNDMFAKKKYESSDEWISRYRDWVISGKRARSQKRRNAISHKNQIRNMLQSKK